MDFAFKVSLMNIDTKTSYWVILFTVCFVAVGLMLNAYNELKRLESSLTPSASLSKLSQPSKVKEAKVEINFKNGTRRMFVADLAAVYPLSLALQLIAEEGKFTYRIKNGKVEEIAGVNGEWRIYRNGEPQNSHLEDLRIEPGDYYIFRQD